MSDQPNPLRTNGAGRPAPKFPRQTPSTNGWSHESSRTGSGFTSDTVSHSRDRGTTVTRVLKDILPSLMKRYPEIHGGQIKEAIDYIRATLIALDHFNRDSRYGRSVDTDRGLSLTILETLRDPYLNKGERKYLTVVANFLSNGECPQGRDRQFLYAGPLSTEGIPSKLSQRTPLGESEYTDARGREQFSEPFQGRNPVSQGQQDLAIHRAQNFVHDENSRRQIDSSVPRRSFAARTSRQPAPARRSGQPQAQRPPQDQATKFDRAQAPTPIPEVGFDLWEATDSRWLAERQPHFQHPDRSLCEVLNLNFHDWKESVQEKLKNVKKFGKGNR